MQTELGSWEQATDGSGRDDNGWFMEATSSQKIKPTFCFKSKTGNSGVQVFLTPV